MEHGDGGGHARQGTPYAPSVHPAHCAKQRPGIQRPASSMHSVRSCGRRTAPPAWLADGSPRVHVTARPTRPCLEDPFAPVNPQGVALEIDRLHAARGPGVASKGSSRLPGKRVKPCHDFRTGFPCPRRRSPQFGQDMLTPGTAGQPPTVRHTRESPPATPTSARLRLSATDRSQDRSTLRAEIRDHRSAVRHVESQCRDVPQSHGHGPGSCQPVHKRLRLLR